MKAILMSIRPEWVAKILNGEKTIEIRKKFPKDYVGWVYIYNTKDIKDGYLTNAYINGKLEFITSFNKHEKYRGKVIARFWCDKVGRINNYPYGYEMYLSGSILTRDIQVMKENEICAKACLTKQELRKYIPCDKERYGYAIHITKLEIFDKPKDISEFETRHWNSKNSFERDNVYELTRAPESYCYIEIE